MIIIIAINIILFCLYNIYIIYKYGLPTSLSETAYMLEKRYWVFTVLCLVTGFSTLPIWFDMGSADWNFLKFLSMIGLVFTGVTPLFKEELNKPIHYTSAIITCICMLCWLGLSGCWWTLGIGVGLFVLLTIIDYKRVVYYGEVACWLGLLLYILIENI